MNQRHQHHNRKPFSFHGAETSTTPKWKRMLVNTRQEPDNPGLKSDETLTENSAFVDLPKSVYLLNTQKLVKNFCYTKRHTAGNGQGHCRTPGNLQFQAFSV